MPSYGAVQTTDIGRGSEAQPHGHRKEDVGLGNSILIETAPRRFHSVGSLIVVIKTPDEIKEYFSPIGNSDVPYPFAVGEQNVYILMDSVYIPHGMWDRQRLPDPYEPYYNGGIGGPFDVPADVADPNPTTQEARKARGIATRQRMTGLQEQYPIVRELVMGRQWTAEAGVDDE